MDEITARTVKSMADEIVALRRQQGRQKRQESTATTSIAWTSVTGKPSVFPPDPATANVWTGQQTFNTAAGTPALFGVITTDYQGVWGGAGDAGRSNLRLDSLQYSSIFFHHTGQAVGTIRYTNNTFEIGAPGTGTNNTSTASAVKLGATQVNSDGGIELSINGPGTGDRTTYIDFHATGDSSTDFHARIRRYAGANGELELYNTGTGGIWIRGSSDIILRPAASGKSVLIPNLAWDAYVHNFNVNGDATHTGAVAATNFRGGAAVFTAYANWGAYGYGADAAGAAIYNSNEASYQALMVVGNNSGGGGIRRVKVWDELTVNGNLLTTGVVRAGTFVNAPIRMPPLDWISVSTTSYHAVIDWACSNAIRWTVMHYVNSQSSGDYWLVYLKKSSDGATVASFDTRNYASGQWVFTAFTGTWALTQSAKGLYVHAIKTGNPGNFSISSAVMTV